MDASQGQDERALDSLLTAADGSIRLTAIALVAAESPAPCAPHALSDDTAFPSSAPAEPGGGGQQPAHIRSESFREASRVPLWAEPNPRPGQNELVILDGWEPETDVAVPSQNRVPASAQSVAQARIGQHLAVDSSEE